MAQQPVIIVGAGPAGVCAAETLVAYGIRPVVIDEADRCGGQIYRRQPAHFTRDYATLYGSEAARAQNLHLSFEALLGAIDYHPNSLVWGLLENKLHVMRDQTTQAMPFASLILATGATDRIMPLPGWTLPGVYSLGASQIALKAQGCAIGERVVFMGTGPLLYLVAYQYLKAGNPPLAVLDTSSLRDNLSGLPLMALRPEQLFKGFGYIRALKAAGVKLYRGIKPLGLEGVAETGVSAVHFSHQGQTVTVECNAVGLGYHLRSESQLADLAGCRFSFDAVSRQWYPDIDEMGRSSASGVYLAGDGVRLLGADAAEVSGRLAAFAVLRDRGVIVAQNEISALLKQMRKHCRFARGVQKAFPWPAAQAKTLPDQTVICRCEVIDAGELRRAAGPFGSPEVNRAKAFARVGMGRCQGRFCGQAAQEIVAAARGCDVADVGRLRGQAPVKPLPVALHAMEDEHEQAG